MSPTRFRLQELLDSYDPPVSQSELARRAGVSFATINRICGNVTAQVSLETLDRIAEALDVDPGDILERTPRRKR